MSEGNPGTGGAGASSAGNPTSEDGPTFQPRFLRTTRERFDALGLWGLTPEFRKGRTPTSWWAADRERVLARFPPNYANRCLLNERRLSGSAGGRWNGRHWGALLLDGFALGERQVLAQAAVQSPTANDPCWSTSAAGGWAAETHKATFGAICLILKAASFHVALRRA
ncbi:hypothetical protein [Sphingomonas sp. PvP018]|uniref:hypothetical protein n=1 Tax=Sphingomonas sp. PvP018 TaxID=2817852 RepID=UPI001AE86FBD|nr:hypothetical protein [Sphingomonas sp. PvP018]MBP2512111.1 hypothetical protein [Sphingomonas sp. PvP018]